jgi:hypothetical protein
MLAASGKFPPNNHQIATVADAGVLWERTRVRCVQYPLIEIILFACIISKF